MIAFRGSFSASMSKLVQMSRHVLTLEKTSRKLNFSLSFEWQMQLVSSKDSGRPSFPRAFLPRDRKVTAAEIA